MAWVRNTRCLEDIKELRDENAKLEDIIKKDAAEKAELKNKIAEQEGKIAVLGSRDACVGV